MTASAHIGRHEFCALFGVDEHQAPEPFHAYWERCDTHYRAVTREEVEAYTLDSLQRAERSRHSASFDNQGAFEQGWRENLELALAQGLNAEALRPRYFRPSSFLRFRKSLIAPQDPYLEYDLFVLARLLLFSRLLAPFDHVYEFGCGSCANLLMLSELYPGKHLHGFDWAPASVEIAQVLQRQGGKAVDGRLFDMLAPDPGAIVEPGSAILTIHAMEQLGERHGPLLEYLLASRPALVVNYEPIAELYDPDNLYDYLALNYTRRRGYLDGYLDALRRLEGEGRVELIDVRRPELGGVYHEASLVVWRPR